MFVRLKNMMYKIARKGINYFAAYQTFWIHCVQNVFGELLFLPKNIRMCSRTSKK